MENICEFCNKQYNSLSNLNYHKKTAKFCLKLQQSKQEENNTSININTNFTCEHCEKTFTTKFALTRHNLICNIKILKDKLSQELKVKDEQYLKEKSELEKQIITQCERISNLENIIKEKDTIIKEKDTIIKEKDAILAKNYDKLATEFANRPNIVNNNTNNSYTIEFNKLKDDLLPFTEENIRNCIKTINSNTLIYFNDFNVSANFIGNFINSVKTLAFCTDSSRGCLVVKDENGKSSKIMARAFTAKCFDKGKKECIQVLDKAVKFLEQENKNQDIDDTEFSKCLNMLTYIKGHITQGTENEFIRELSSNLTKIVPQITKNKPTNALLNEELRSP